MSLGLTKTNKQTNKNPEILFKVTHTIGIYGTRVAEGFKVKSSLYFYSALYNTNCFNASIVLYTIQIVSNCFQCRFVNTRRARIP